MSCQIKPVAQLIDIDSIRRCLFPTDDLRGTDAWLQNCIIAVSPTGELIVMAREKKLVVLNAKWNSLSTKINFHVSFTGCLDNSDFITAVTCIPIAANGKSTEVGPDWTCIVIGYASGIVKFYTENCSLLASEQFHNERVVSIKCQSMRREKIVGFDNFPEEIHVVYPTNICLINGVNLIQTLRNYRSELARVQAKGENLDPLSTLVNPKKWEIVDQTVVNDTAIVGVDAANTFDHLLTASTCGGFYSKYRAMAPHNTLVMGVGAKPYIAFHYAIEGGTQPVLTDVAKAVASKLKAALPGWLTGSRSQSVEKTSQVPVIPAEPMGCRFGLHDPRRIADRITLSPDKTLAVVSDSLGRIALVDTKKGVCLRMWKGYREAEYSFIQVHEESSLKRAKNTPKTHSKPHKVALFLVIYAPKKGTIELWVMQQGPKIATFTASKNSRLLYTHHGIMGLARSPSKNKCNCQFSSVFIDPDGQVKEIIIPFHFSLSDKNSNRARDIHLVKRLKSLLKNENVNDSEKILQEITNTCNELKTNELRLQCVEMLMNLKQVQPPIILETARIISEKVAPDESDTEVTHLLTLCNNLYLITNFYMYAVGEWPDMLDLDNGNRNVSVKKQKPKLCDTIFSIPEKEMNSLQRLLDFSCLKRKEIQTKVTFKNKKSITFSEYLNSFELTQTNIYISLKKNLSEEKMFRMSEVLFKSFILCDVLDVANFKKQISESCIETIDLIKLILAFWVQRPLNININLETEMQSLSKLIYSICQTTKLENICVQYNDVSPFWKSIRDTLAMSSNSFQALTAAVLCRSVAQKLEFDRELLSSRGSCGSSNSVEDDVNTEIWEKLSQDNCQWSILIGKLEDISLLNIILSSKPIIDNSVLPKIDYESEEISLKYITQKGKGAVSELVARWLIECGADPEFLLPPTSENINNDNKDDEKLDEINEQIKASKDLNREITEGTVQLQESITILKKQFPYSLESNILLANMAWEYILYWQKKIYHCYYLAAALKCIKSIPNAQIKSGICFMIWNAHIKLLLENTSKLINKVGKLPKERLCRQDTGLSDVQLNEFVNYVVEFLNLFLESLQLLYKSTHDTVVDIKYENVWDSDVQGGVVPLIELILQQTNINYDLLHLHYQLTLVLQMITNLNVKHTKPIHNLFDSTSVSLLFTDLTSNCNVPIYNSDTKLVSSRTQFLMKVITSTIESVRSQDDVIYSSEHIRWMSKCLTLGSDWGLDATILKGHQVEELFENGFDSLAVEVLPSISDASSIGPALLAIAGKRLLSLLVTSPDLKEKMANLSPTLTSYLDTLNFSDEWCASSSVENIKELASHALRCLTHNDQERRIASLMLEACSSIEEES